MDIHRRDFLKGLALLPMLGLAWRHRLTNAGQGSSPRPNVLFLVFDTVSAPHLSLFGYPRPTTPNLDRLAASSTVFHRCSAGGNFTTPGTASLLTGTYPWSHRALHMHGIAREEFREKNLFHLLSPDMYTVAYSHNLLVTSLLHQFGGTLDVLKSTRDLCLFDDEYSDLVFPGDYNASFWSEWQALRGLGAQPSSLYLSLIQRVLRYWHKSQVQALYGEQFPRGIPNLHNLFFVLEDAIDWMSQEIPRFPQPFLAYFHLLPPHEPYMARRDFVDVFRDGWSPTVKPEAMFSDGVGPGELNRQRRHYDEYLAYADSEIGRLLEGLERSGVLENTILVFTSDHGEMFERGIRGHVTPMLYDPILHVPLLIRLPQQRERRDVYTPVSTVDILPTLLHLQGKDIPSWCEGEVLPGVREGTADSERGVFAVEAKSNPTQAPLTKASFALRRGPHKLTRYAGYRGSEAAYELYDLEADPEEQIDLLAVDRPLAKRLMAELDDKLREVDRPLG